MNGWASLITGWLLAVALVTPAWGRTVRIETVVALVDHSEETLKRAMEQALEDAVRRATAMGLNSTWLAEGWVLPDALVLWIIATDDDEGGQDVDPAVTHQQRQAPPPNVPE